MVENDCEHRPRYAPWIAAVFVLQEHRGRGIASLVLQEAAVVVRRAGVGGLYIDCHVDTIPLYTKNGWSALEERVGDDRSVVMYRETAGE